MKKINFFALLLGFSAMSIKAQTALPASCDFNTFAASGLPANWTTNITTTNVYATGGVGGTPAIKFALITPLQYVQVNTADAMGIASYVLKGYAGTGVTSWQGGFLVEESVNGTTWTTLATYTNTQIVINTLTTFTAAPNSNSRYLRWIHTNKLSGFNVALDDINISAAPVTAQEINVKQGLTTVLSGGSSSYFNSAVGTPTNVNFTIQNLGTVNTLSISSISISGPNASDFSVSAPSILPTTVGTSTSIPLTLSFNPSAAGTRSAILTINNNDLDESAYVINLNGIGGLFASSPLTQPTGLTFSNIKSYRAKANFVLATGSPSGYLILKKQGSSAISDVPVDGVSYQVGDAVGSSKVIYSTTTNTIGLSNIYAGQQYQLAIFSYNGSGSFINYNQTAPLTGNFTALSSMQPALEYASLNVTNTNFLSSLTAQIYPHTSVFYGNYDETMIKLFTARDTTAGQKVVTCVYSSENYVYTEPFTFSYITREHSYCHNWMPSNPADSPERPEYNDQHHLFPTQQTNANAARSNYPMGEIVGVPTSTYLACKGGNDINGNHVFEPRSQQKGDFARAVMYMATAYNGQLKSGVVMDWKLRNPITPGTMAYGQDQNILKKWHYQDPPDAFEISRNDFLDSLQGNRNPFIDSVRYACYIDFSNMTYIANPTYTTGIGTPCYVASSVGLYESTPLNFEYILAPNPTSGEFYLMIEANVAETFQLTITDLAGRNMYSKNVDVANGFNNLKINDIDLASGVYFVNLNYKNEKITRKLIIE